MTYSRLFMFTVFVCFLFQGCGFDSLLGRNIDATSTSDQQTNNNGDNQDNDNTFGTREERPKCPSTLLSSMSCSLPEYATCVFGKECMDGSVGSMTCTCNQGQFTCTKPC